ncbi:hypothetical protein [Novosphingobium sp. KN65.2]|uniref:hypothetical protein n=1 Tax=Novosphingobium sp. KN65.2 TaxID=1478134 RepID=UPI0018D094F2|nr:hypothetical protein [Novosphingobium sp. KN65.2]
MVNELARGIGEWTGGLPAYQSLHHWCGSAAELRIPEADCPLISQKIAQVLCVDDF